MIGMSGNRKTKKALFLDEKEGEKPLLGRVYIKREGMPPPCGSCALRLSGYCPSRIVDIDANRNADPGSKESGIKKLFGQAACFHIEQFELIAVSNDSLNMFRDISDVSAKMFNGGSMF